jgi:hypothetical protein
VTSVCVEDVQNPAMSTVNVVCGAHKFIKKNVSVYGCKHGIDALKS